MSFGDYGTILNDFVEVLIPGEEQLTDLAFFQFFLVFIFLFAIIFSSTQFIPAFKDPKMKNSRMFLALAVAYFGTTTFFTMITQYLEWFGFIAAVAIGLGAVLLAIIPKDKRDKYAPAVSLISIAGAIFILAWTSFQEGMFITFTAIWSFILSNPAISIPILIVAVIIIIVLANKAGKKSGSTPPGP